MEQEVRQLLEARYTSREAVLASIQRRWCELPAATARDLERWRSEGRR